jgi:exopolyphosphatase/guanosine-5'-triphosphate,3'-diphosphate pyrophosphatase
VSAPVAAIDCGTNSTRLLVSDGRAKPLERLMRITRLGEAVDATGRLSVAAIQRTSDTLREYRDVMDGFGVARVRMTATSAARDAVNRDEFFQSARQAIGVEPELLTGDEEGRLSFLGATRELDPANGPFLVVDIGGGSTELVLGADRPNGVHSLDVGCVRVTEKFLHRDPPAPDELSDALSEVRDLLEDVIRQQPEVAEARLMVGLAGTITTVAAVEIGLPVYDRQRIHHFDLTRNAVEDVFRTLATERRADRIHNPGLEEARADVIVGGCVVLAAVMRFFGFDHCLVSEADLLDGIAIELLESGG